MKIYPAKRKRNVKTTGEVQKLPREKEKIKTIKTAGGKSNYNSQIRKKSGRKKR